MSERDSVNPTLDRVFDALRASERRRVLAELYDGESDEHQRIPVRATAPADVQTDRYVSRMAHSHVPKLVDLGYVEYDDTDMTLERGPRFEEVRRVIARLTGDDRSPPLSFP